MLINHSKNSPHKNWVTEWAKKKSYRVQYSNANLYRWLMTIGLTPAKTLTVGAIKVPNKFFMDFLRGHLDGDRSIKSYTDAYNIYRGRRYSVERLALFFISASKEHIVWLQEKVLEITGCRGAIMSSMMKSGNFLWTVKYSKKESIALLTKIYYSPNVPCLERKRVIATNGLNKCLNKQRKTYTLISN